MNDATDERIDEKCARSELPVPEEEGADVEDALLLRQYVGTIEERRFSGSNEVVGGGVSTVAVPSYLFKRYPSTHNQKSTYKA
jgi:hypothetical protein